MKKDELLPELENFKTLVNYVAKEYKNNVAYKYRANHEDRSSKIITQTYQTACNDIKALATALLEKSFYGKRIAVIGHNRYEWVVSYFALLSGGMVVAPMDKMLPERELELLIRRSSVEAIIFDKSSLDILKKLKQDKSNNLKTLICMDDLYDEDVINYSSLLSEGYELLKKRKQFV